MHKQDLVFAKPICNAPGILGFSPAPQRMPFLNQLGAFFTNPVSQHARTPAGSRSAIRFPGGILLHSGFPNPGLSKVLEKHAARWERSPVPVIPHIMAEATSSLESLLRPLEEISNLMAVEISFPPEWSDSDILKSIAAVTSELPLILTLEPDRILAFAPRLQSLPISAISMAARRGSLTSEAGGIVSGRVYGPALFPQTLHLVRLADDAGIPLIASGGIYSEEQAMQCLKAGAIAVQADTVFWSVGDNHPLFDSIIQE